VPSVRGGDDKPFVFPTKIEAEREIADFMITCLQEVVDGQRSLDEALPIDEYIVEVELSPDGSVVDSDGRRFASRRPEP
jgi:hypothetical protein